MQLVIVTDLDGTLLDPATYALGPVDTREAIIIYNEVTKLTAAKTVEYFI